MLGTFEMIREAQLSRLKERLSECKQVPIYRRRLSQRADFLAGDRDLAGFEEVPFISKREMREGFPGNFLHPGQSLERLLEEGLVELEHTPAHRKSNFRCFSGAVGGKTRRNGRFGETHFCAGRWTIGRTPGAQR